MKEHVADVVAAYVRKNRIEAGQLPEVIALVNQAFASLGQAAEPPSELTPAVPIRRSVSAETITCLDCGWKGQMIKRHLTSAHGLSVDEYRQRWGLPPDYPVVAKGYAARRSELAKSLGLGRKRTTGD